MLTVIGDDEDTVIVIILLKTVALDDLEEMLKNKVLVFGDGLFFADADSGKDPE